MDAPATAPWVLVVEDDAELSQMLSDILAGGGYKAVRVSRAQDAIAKLQLQLFPAIVLDMHLEKGSSGEESFALKSSKKEMNHLTLSSSRADCSTPTSSNASASTSPACS